MDRMIGLMGDVLTTVLTRVSNSLHESHERQGTIMYDVIERTVSRMDLQNWALAAVEAVVVPPGGLP